MWGRKRWGSGEVRRGDVERRDVGMCECEAWGRGDVRRGDVHRGRSESSTTGRRTTQFWFDTLGLVLPPGPPRRVSRVLIWTDDVGTLYPSEVEESGGCKRVLYSVECTCTGGGLPSSRDVCVPATTVCRPP